MARSRNRATFRTGAQRPAPPSKPLTPAQRRKIIAKARAARTS